MSKKHKRKNWGSANIVDKVEKPFNKRTIPICWGIPMDEVSFSRFWINYIRNSDMLPEDGHVHTTSTYLPDARNTIHEWFVKNSNLPYLMMLDSDILFPPDMLNKLIAHNLPIVGGWYKNKADGHPVIYDFVSTSDDGVNNFRRREVPGTGLEKVDGMGAGCWLMSRQTAIALGERPYDMSVGGEDLYICKKMMDLNIPLHVDWSINCAHLGVHYT